MPQTGQHAGKHRRYPSIIHSPVTSVAVLSAAIGHHNDVAALSEEAQPHPLASVMPGGAEIEQLGLEKAGTVECHEVRKLRTEVAGLKTALEQAQSNSLITRNLILERRRKGDEHLSRAKKAERNSKIYREEAAFWERANRRSELRANRLKERLERGEGRCHCQEIMIFEGICRVVESFWITITRAGKTY